MDQGQLEKYLSAQGAYGSQLRFSDRWEKTGTGQGNIPSVNGGFPIISQRIVHYNLDEHHCHLHKTVWRTKNHDIFYGSDTWPEGRAANYNI